MLRDLSRCLSLLDPPLGRRWRLLVPLGVVAAAAEAVGAAAVFGLLTVVMEPARAATLPVFSTVDRWLGSPGPRAIVIALTLLLIGFYLVRNALLAFAAWAQERVVHDSVAAVARRLLLGYLTVPWSFHFRRNSAGLIQRVSQSAEVAFTMVASPIVHTLVEGLTIAAIAAVLAFTAPLATLVAAAVIGLLILVPTRLTAPVFARLGRAENAGEESMLQALQQSLGAMKEVKIAARERYFHDRFSAVVGALTRARRRRTTLQEIVRLSVETVFVVGLLLVVLLLALRGQPGPEIVSLLGLYGYAGFRLVPSANRIGRNVGNIKVGRPYLDAVFEDLQIVEAFGDPAAREDAGGPPFADAVRFEDVSYAYDEDGPAVLRDVALEIRRGESIGVVGPTGAGKSTLIDLLLGLIAPTTGRITIDGRDLAGRSRWWQRQIGYVPQTFALFDDTLRRNVAFGIPDDEVDEARLLEAVRSAQLDEVVAGLPDGLDTLVGERGIRLSGGQRQRVVIARALYHEPRVLVFDEATSSLDTQTEREVTRAIEALHGAVTLVVIAHRLSTVRGCDRLIVLREGRVEAIGTYDALRATSAAFRAMTDE